MQPSLDQIDGLLLAGDILQGHGIPPLVAPEFHIVPGDLGLQGDQGIAQVSLGCVIGGIRRLHGPPGAAKNIQLPIGIETGLEEVVGPPRGGGIEAASAACGGDGGVDCAGCPGNNALGPGLADMGLGNTEVLV